MRSEPIATGGGHGDVNPPNGRVDGRVVPTPNPSASDAPRPLRVVALGGGTGLPAVVDGLCTEAAEHGEAGGEVTAVATVTDDGGSSGRLRREFGVLPPGDVRNCLVAAAPTDSPFRQLLQYRFRGALPFDGHPVGNLLLTALSEITGDFPEAVRRLSAMIPLRGRVLPATGENVRLRAEMESGEVLTGETAIVGKGIRIRHLALEPSPRPLPDVLRALVNADGIVVGPGSLYTSVIPTLLVEGIASTLSAVDAVRVYVANLMTEPGETDGYTLDDHLHAIWAHTRFDLFDYILVNRSAWDPVVAARYRSKGAFPIQSNGPLKWIGRARVVECDFAPDYGGEKIRHQPSAVARAIRGVIAAGRTTAVVPSDPPSPQPLRWRCGFETLRPNRPAL
jgi:uncharacterized cofD-like protein